MEEAWGDAGLSRLTQIQNRFTDRIRHRGAAEAAVHRGTAPDLSALEGHQYCLLVTFKRDGAPVPTPVWFGLDEEHAYVRSEDDTAKVKRLRRDTHVRVGPCTSRGKPIGPLAEARARILPPDEEEHAEQAIQSNYGVVRRTFEGVGERLGVPGVYIEITATGDRA